MAVRELREESEKETAADIHGQRPVRKFEACQKAMNVPGYKVAENRAQESSNTDEQNSHHAPLLSKSIGRSHQHAAVMADSIAVIRKDYSVTWMNNQTH